MGGPWQKAFPSTFHLPKSSPSKSSNRIGGRSGRSRTGSMLCSSIVRSSWVTIRLRRFAVNLAAGSRHVVYARHPMAPRLTTSGRHTAFSSQPNTLALTDLFEVFAMVTCNRVAGKAESRATQLTVTQDIVGRKQKPGIGGDGRELTPCLHVPGRRNWRRFGWPCSGEFGRSRGVDIWPKRGLGVYRSARNGEQR